jgi:hypothetical protein
VGDQEKEALMEDGSGVGVRSAPTQQDERLAELLELVLDRNPFKRDLVADQERHPPYGTNLT